MHEVEVKPTVKFYFIFLIYFTVIVEETMRLIHIITIEWTIIFFVIWFTHFGCCARRQLRDRHHDC